MTIKARRDGRRAPESMEETVRSQNARGKRSLPASGCSLIYP